MHGVGQLLVGQVYNLELRIEQVVHRTGAISWKWVSPVMSWPQSFSGGIKTGSQLVYNLIQAQVSQEMRVEMPGCFFLYIKIATGPDLSKSLAVCFVLWCK